MSVVQSGTKLVASAQRTAFLFLKFTTRSAIVAHAKALSVQTPSEILAANRPPRPPVVSKTKKGSGRNYFRARTQKGSR